MAERPQRKRAGRRSTVTVWTKDGTPVQYPKSQLDRIEESERYFLVPPVSQRAEATAAEAEPDKPKPKPKAGKK